MYSEIVNPKTGRMVSVNGKLGLEILRNYLFVLSGGAASATKKGENVLYSRDTRSSDRNPRPTAVNVLEAGDFPSEEVLQRYYAEQPLSEEESQLVRQYILRRGLLMHTKGKQGPLGDVATSSNNIFSPLGRVAQFLGPRLRDFTATDLPVATLSVHSDEVCGVAVLSDGRIVSGSRDDTVQVWLNGSDGGWANETTLTAHSGSVLSVVAIPGGGIVSGGDDMKVWKEEDGSGWVREVTLRRWKQYDSVRSMAVMSDGCIVSGGAERNGGLLEVMRKSSGGWKLADSILGHKKAVMSVAVCPNTGRIVGGSDNTVKVWRKAELTRGQRKRRWVEEATLTGHTFVVRGVAVMSDGRIVSGSQDKTVKVWQEESRGVWVATTLAGHGEYVLSVAVMSDGRIVSGSADNTVKVWRETRRGVWVVDATLTGHSRGVLCVAVMPDGRIVSGSSDYTVKVWG